MDLPDRPGAPHRADLFFPLDPSTARSVHDALLPETGSDVPKTTSRLALEPWGVRVLVWADDLSSLRAAVNSYARWVDAAVKAAKLGAR